jgi:hypothetical protein
MQGDAIILAWSQRLVADRAALVRSVLEHSRIPVILVPIARKAKRVPFRPRHRKGAAISRSGTAIRLWTLPGGLRQEANAGRLRRN